MEIVNNKVYRVKDRDIIKVKLDSGQMQGFYKSTGRNSGKKGTWFPFDGIVHYEENPIWFVKDSYRSRDSYGNPTNLHRYGTQELKGISDRLATMKIPCGRHTIPSTVNKFLGKDFSCS